MKRKLAILVLMMFSTTCEPRMTEKLPERTHTPPSSLPSKHPLVAKISEILQAGWEVTYDGNIIVISRHDPVSTYGNIATPPMGSGLKEIMTERAHKLSYYIAIEIGDFVSKAERKRMLDVNSETDRELERRSYAMASFRSKVDWLPKSESEKNLYEEYRTALRTLPYERVPDLYDDHNSYYVWTPRQGRTSFSYPREERECRAVLENIFSFLDAYGDLNAKTGADEDFDYPFDEKVHAVFESARGYDKHLLRKEDNLPELRGYR